MICTCERGNDDFYQNTLVASLIINPGWTFEPPIMSELVVAPRATTTALQYSSLKYCVAVFKEEAIAAKWFVSMKCTKANPKHRFAFLRLKFTVSFFSLPCKRLENTRKALKIQPFVLFRANS